jgi:LAO/AO transport system kinase
MTDGDADATSGGDDLVDDLLAGEHRALARVITKIENRRPGYRELVARLHEHTGNAEVIGITGSPGAGKSTLVDKLALAYREQGLTVGVIAVDPSSPFTGGAVLGDRIRMASNVGDMDVFVRSMSARGTLGGLSTATSDAIKALDAFGKDRIIIETVGAGQNEVDVVRTADTVAVLVQPGSGDDIQMLKAGILEIGDVFVVNKADMDGADRTVQQLREMIQQNQGDYEPEQMGHHGEVEVDVEAVAKRAWEPRVVETIATEGTGVDDLVTALSDHRAFLEESGRLTEKVRTRYAEELWTLVREDLGELVDAEFEARGGLDAVVDDVVERETDPYTLAEEVVAPIADCVDERE